MNKNQGKKLKMRKIAKNSNAGMYNKVFYSIETKNTKICQRPKNKLFNKLGVSWKLE